jgi:hypothetical protein
MATPSVAQIYAFGANVQSAGVSSSSYTIRVANQWGAGNTVAVIIEMSHGNTLSAMHDDAGTTNTWSTTANVSADSGTGGFLTNAYILGNVNAGGRVLTVTLTSSDDNVKFTVIEFYNTASSSIVGSTTQSHTAAAPTVSAPAITGTSGSLLIQYGIDNSNLIGLGNNAVTTITAGSSWTMLAGDYAANSTANSAMNSWAMQSITATGSSQTPSFTTSGTATYNTICFEIKGGTTGTAPAAGIHINKVHCFTNTNIQTTPMKLFFPGTGNCIVLFEDTGSLRSAPSDTVGNSWTLDVTGTSAPVTPVAHAKNVAVSQTNAISCPCVSDSGNASGSNPVNTSYYVFDIGGADTNNPKVQTVTFPVTSEGTSWSGTCSITPQTKNGLILNYAGTGIGPILTQTGPSGSFYISPNYTGETDGDSMNNANAMSVTYYGSSLSAQSYGYTIASGTTINATAIEIQIPPQLAGDEDFWLPGGSDGRPPRRRELEPVVTVF